MNSINESKHAYIYSAVRVCNQGWESVDKKWTRERTGVNQPTKHACSQPTNKPPREQTNQYERSNEETNQDIRYIIRKDIE